MSSYDIFWDTTEGNIHLIFFLSQRTWKREKKYMHYIFLPLDAAKSYKGVFNVYIYFCPLPFAKFIDLLLHPNGVVGAEIYCIKSIKFDHLSFGVARVSIESGCSTAEGRILSRQSQKRQTVSGHENWGDAKVETDRQEALMKTREEICGCGERGQEVQWCEVRRCREDERRWDEWLRKYAWREKLKGEGDAQQVGRRVVLIGSRV